VAFALAAGTAVGWIESFDGTPEQYRLVRSGKEMPVSMFLPIHHGDDIAVLQGGRRIRLILDGGRVVEELTQSNSRYVVRESRRVPTLPDNLINWAGSWFTKWHQERLTTVSVHVRSDKNISIPLLADRRQLLVVSDRALAIAWKGGAPPFTVRVGLDVSTRGAFVSAEGLSGRRVLLPDVALAPGRYSVRIADSHGSEATAPFSVVARERLPSEPESIRFAAPDVTRQTLLAAWLTTVESGEWVFQGYQQAALLTQEYYPAGLLRDAIERGDYPRGSPN
jgi:hypothetical protein